MMNRFPRKQPPGKQRKESEVLDDWLGLKQRKSQAIPENEAQEGEDEETTKYKGSLRDMFPEADSKVTYDPNGTQIPENNGFQKSITPKRKIVRIELKESDLAGYSFIKKNESQQKKHSTVDKFITNFNLKNPALMTKNSIYDDVDIEAHTEIFSKDPEIVKMVLKLGADPNLHDKNGFTPLMRAVLRGGKHGKKIIKLLIGHPLTDVNQRHVYSKHGYTALHYACMATPKVTIKLPENKSNMFYPKCVGGFVGGVKVLLKSKKIDPNVRDETTGGTCLHHAACHNFVAVLKTLLTHKKINPNLQMNDGNTPLLIAQILKHKKSQIAILKDKRSNFRIKNKKLDSFAVLTTDKDILRIIANKK